MVLLIIILVLLLILLALLISPIDLYINTDSNEYYFRFGLIKARLESDVEEILLLRISLFGLRYNFYPMRKIWTASKKQKITKKENSGRTRKSSFTLKKGLRILHSFEVREFYLDIDTGDPITNAKLYPLFSLINFTLADIKINFMGRNSCTVNVHNTPLKIIKSYINI